MELCKSITFLHWKERAGKEKDTLLNREAICMASILKNAINKIYKAFRIIKLPSKNVRRRIVYVF